MPYSRCHKPPGTGAEFYTSVFEGSRIEDSVAPEGAPSGFPASGPSRSGSGVRSPGSGPMGVLGALHHRRHDLPAPTCASSCSKTSQVCDRAVFCALTRYSA